VGDISFLFHLLYQKNIAKFCFFEVFLDQKIISKAVFSSDIRLQQWKNNCMVFQKFPSSKNLWEEFFFLNLFFVSR